MSNELNLPRTISPTIKRDDPTFKVLYYATLGSFHLGGMAPIDTSGYDWIRAEFANVRYRSFTLYVDDDTSIVEGDYYHTDNGGVKAYFKVLEKKDRTLPSGVVSSTYDRVLLCSRANQIEMGLAYFNPSEATGDSFTFSASAGTITIDSGTLITTTGGTVLKPAVDNYVYITGATNSANNGAHLVTAVSDTVVTVSSTLVDETSSVKMRSWEDSNFGKYGPDIQKYTTDTYNFRRYQYDNFWQTNSCVGQEILDWRGDSLATTCNTGTSSSSTSANAFGTRAGVSASATYGDNSDGWTSHCVGDFRFTGGSTYHSDVWSYETHAYANTFLDTNADYTRELGGGFGSQPGVSDIWFQGSSSGIAYYQHRAKMIIKDPPQWFRVGWQRMDSALGFGDSQAVSNYSLVLTMHKETR